MAASNADKLSYGQATQHIQNSNGGGDEVSKVVKDRDEGDSDR